MVAPVVLVEASPRRASDGATVPTRLAGGGGSHAYFYGGEHWRAGIVSLPSVVSSVEFDGENMGGGGIPQALELRWAPGSNAALADAAAQFWIDAPITVRLGAEGGVRLADGSFTLPPAILSGSALGASVSKGTLVVPMADPAAQLKLPLLTERYAGTGGLEGPPEFNGLLKSRAWGRCFNVPGRLLVPAQNIWCFGDPNRRWKAFVDVRDHGAAASPTDLVPLEWQGSAEATLAALEATEAPDGGGVVCPDLACVKWWTSDGVDLHVDILGEIDGGYVETAPEIAARVVAAKSNQPFAAGTIAAARAARLVAFGWRVDDETTTAASALSEMLGDVSTSWVLIAGEIVLRPWAWSAPIAAARSHDATRREVLKPVATRRLGYRRNQGPMARGDLAGIVLATDIAFADGSTLEEVKATVEETAADVAAVVQRIETIEEQYRNLALSADAAIADGVLTPAEKEAVKADLLLNHAASGELSSRAGVMGLDDVEMDAAYAAWRDYVHGRAEWASATLDSPVDATTYRDLKQAYLTAAAALNLQLTQVTADGLDASSSAFAVNGSVRRVGNSFTSTGPSGTVRTQTIADGGAHLRAELVPGGSATAIYIGMSLPADAVSTNPATIAYGFAYSKVTVGGVTSWRLFAIKAGSSVPWNNGETFDAGATIQASYFEANGAAEVLLRVLDSQLRFPDTFAATMGQDLIGKAIFVGAGGEVRALRWEGERRIPYATGIIGPKPPVNATAGGNVATGAHTVGATGPDADGYYTFDGNDMLYIVGGQNESIPWNGEPFVKISVQTKDDTGVGGVVIGLLCETASGGTLSAVMDARKGSDTLRFPLGTQRYQVFHAAAFTSGSIKMRRAVVTPTQDAPAAVAGSAPAASDEGINASLFNTFVNYPNDLTTGYFIFPPGRHHSDPDSWTWWLYGDERMACYSEPPGAVPLDQQFGNANLLDNFTRTFGAKYLTVDIRPAGGGLREKAPSIFTGNGGELIQHRPYAGGGEANGTITVYVYTRKGTGAPALLTSGVLYDNGAGPGLKGTFEIPGGPNAVDRDDYYRIEIVADFTAPAGAFVIQPYMIAKLHNIRATDNSVAVAQITKPVTNTLETTDVTPGFYVDYVHPNAAPGEVSYAVGELRLSSALGFGGNRPLQVATYISRAQIVQGQGLEVAAIGQRATVDGVDYTRQWTGTDDSWLVPGIAPSRPGGPDYAAHGWVQQLATTADALPTIGAHLALPSGEVPSVERVLTEQGNAASADTVPGLGPFAFATDFDEGAPIEAAKLAGIQEGADVTAQHTSAATDSVPGAGPFLYALDLSEAAPIEAAKLGNIADFADVTVDNIPFGVELATRALTRKYSGSPQLTDVATSTQPLQIYSPRYAGSFNRSQESSWALGTTTGLTATIDNDPTSPGRGLVTVSDMDAMVAYVHTISVFDGAPFFTLTRIEKDAAHTRVQLPGQIDAWTQVSGDIVPFVTEQHPRKRLAAQFSFYSDIEATTNNETSIQLKFQGRGFNDTTWTDIALLGDAVGTVKRFNAAGVLDIDVATWDTPNFLLPVATSNSLYFYRFLARPTVLTNSITSLGTVIDLGGYSTTSSMQI